MEAWEVLGGEMVGITVVLVEVKMVVAGGVVEVVELIEVHCRVDVGVKLKLWCRWSEGY